MIKRPAPIHPKGVCICPAFEAMHGCTYRQLDGFLNNSAGMFKMCSQALQGPENKPQVQPNESQLEMNAPQQQNLMAPF